MAAGLSDLDAEEMMQPEFAGVSGRSMLVRAWRRLRCSMPGINSESMYPSSGKGAPDAGKFA